MNMDGYRGKLLVGLAKGNNRRSQTSETEKNLIPIQLSKESSILSETIAGWESNITITTENEILGKEADSLKSSESLEDFSGDDYVKDKTWDPNENCSNVERHSKSPNNVDATDTNLRNFSKENEGAEASPDEIVVGVEFQNENIKSRKRIRETKKWEINQRKMNKNLGKSYVTKKGKLVPEKKLKSSCGGLCKFKCSLFTENERQIIFKNFWSIGDIELQRCFIAKCVDDVVTKYRYIREGSKRIGLNHSYHFSNSSGEKTRVCKQFFMSTLNVGDRTIRTALAKVNANANIVEGDLRGKHSSHRKTNEEIIGKIKEHIDSFPRIESHYLRNQTKREYISGNLTLAEMYRLYLQKCDEEKITPAKISMYSKVFNTEFNIGFFLPKKDQCALCAKYLNSNSKEKDIMKQEMDIHENEIKKSREQKRIDKEKAIEDPENFITVCYDLQAVLNTPLSHVSNFYYSRKFASYNFTLCNIGNNKGYCYLWHEDQGNRGANEIGTCVYNFLMNYCDNRAVTFYSDNCMGQQKNKFIVCMYLFVTKNCNITSITHNFLIVGHTQNEGDSMHSVIEKNVSRTIKAGSIYSPLEWRIIIQNAKKTGSSYNVSELSFNEFLDLKSLSQQVGENFNVNSKGEKINWNSIKAIRVEKSNPDTMFYKTSYDESEFSNFINIIPQKTRKKTFRMPNEIQKAFKEPPGISEIKKKDLVGLCDAKLIPEIYHSFYKTLKTCSNKDLEEL